ncbi:hypothetical protein AGDE_10070 [Angomonas deanei]|nr:hypothetical protein AGDE_10070 [Angomonas deanei]|eukprot:EPY29210.1 hypothetical protein AGDE_10070 [Angomonas deanei]
MKESGDPDYLTSLVGFPFVPCKYIDVNLTTYYKNVDDLDYSLSYKLFTGTNRDAFDMNTPYIKDQPAGNVGTCLVLARSILGRGRLSLDISVNTRREGYKPEMTATHVIKDVTVASVGFKAGIFKGITDTTVSPLKGRKQVVQTASPPTVFHYYLQAVYTTVDLPNQPTVKGYQQTAVWTQLSDPRATPGVHISYDTSGFASQCSKNYATPSHFFVHLCAVAGGVYTVASFIELMLEQMAKVKRKQLRKEEHAKNTQNAVSTA